eukprot:7925903-Prorocentrum_lima.AAC.1
MTSSLVDSEMCIRDRRFQETRQQESERADDIAMFTGGGDEDKLKKAVSYTHLTLPTICSV